MLRFFKALVSLFSLFTFQTGGGVDPNGFTDGSSPSGEGGGGVDPDGRT